MKIVDLKQVKCGPRPPVEELLEPAGRLLRTGRLQETLRVDESLNLVRDDYRLFHALKILGVMRVPVSLGSKESVDITLEELGFEEDISTNVYRVCRDHSELIRSCWPTPLMYLKSMSEDGSEVWAKLEYMNPFSNSIKDRIGWYMILDALEEGLGLGRGRMIYEASSTNTGIALTCVSRGLGLKTRIYLPSTVQRCSDAYLRILGSEVVRSSERLTTEMLDRVREDSKRDGAVHINQFENDANFISHLRFTAKELDIQLRRAGLRPSRIVCSLGTSGHASALSFYFKNRYGGEVEVVCVQPAENNVIPGMRRIETGMKWIHLVEVDRLVEVTAEEAIKGMSKIAAGEGLPVGLSSGAVAAALEKIPTARGVTVLVMPDHIYKYGEVLEGCHLRERGAGRD